MSRYLAGSDQTTAVKYNRIRSTKNFNVVLLNLLKYNQEVLLRNATNVMDPVNQKSIPDQKIDIKRRKF